MEILSFCGLQNYGLILHAKSFSQWIHLHMVMYTEHEAVMKSLWNMTKYILHEWTCRRQIKLPKNIFGEKRCEWNWHRVHMLYVCVCVTMHLEQEERDVENSLQSYYYFTIIIIHYVCRRADGSAVFIHPYSILMFIISVCLCSTPAKPNQNCNTQCECNNIIIFILLYVCMHIYIVCLCHEERKVHLKRIYIYTIAPKFQSL